MSVVEAKQRNTFVATYKVVNSPSHRLQSELGLPDDWFKELWLEKVFNYKKGFFNSDEIVTTGKYKLVGLLEDGVDEKLWNSPVFLFK